MNRPSRIHSVAFVNLSIERAFLALAEGSFQDQQLWSSIQSAIQKLKENPSCGVKIPRKLWPNEFIRHHGITNLWKLNLVDGWRLTYYLKGDSVEVISIIIEWGDHTQYDRRYGYR